MSGGGVGGEEVGVGLSRAARTFMCVKTLSLVLVSQATSIC